MAITHSDKIRQLENQLEDLKREKNGLQKIISHDIRSPFNKIQALIQLMKMNEELLNKDQIEYLSSMHITVMSGLELVRNMHDANLIEEGEIKISKEQIDLVTTVKKAISNFVELGELKGIKLHFNSFLKSALILGDDYYLQRSIENLLSNAVKYSYEDKPVNIDLDKEDNIISLRITNFGQGIKAEEVDLLFKKYSKLSSRPSKGEGSSGLGLYITQYFIEKMDGEVFFHHQNNGMTTFVMQLPA